MSPEDYMDNYSQSLKQREKMTRVFDPPLINMSHFLLKSSKYFLAGKYNGVYLTVASVLRENHNFAQAKS